MGACWAIISVVRARSARPRAASASAPRRASGEAGRRRRRWGIRARRGGKLGGPAEGEALVDALALMRRDDAGKPLEGGVTRRGALQRRWGGTVLRVVV